MTTENVGSASENGVGNFDDLVRFVESIVYTLIPKADKQFTVTGDQNRKRLAFTIKFDNDDYVGLFFGYGMSNLNALLQLVRAQQVFPHDRYIQLSVVRSDGNEQVFLNKDVSKYRKEDERKAKADGANDDQAHEAARTLSERRRLIRIPQTKEQA